MEEDSYYINDGAWPAFDGDPFALGALDIGEIRLSIRHDSRQEYSHGEADSQYRRCNVGFADGHAGVLRRLDSESTKFNSPYDPSGQ